MIVIEKEIGKETGKGRGQETDETRAQVDLEAQGAQIPALKGKLKDSIQRPSFNSSSIFMVEVNCRSEYRPFAVYRSLSKVPVLIH